MHHNTCIFKHSLYIRIFNFLITHKVQIQLTWHAIQEISAPAFNLGERGSQLLQTKHTNAPPQAPRNKTQMAEQRRDIYGDLHNVDMDFLLGHDEMLNK